MDLLILLEGAVMARVTFIDEERQPKVVSQTNSNWCNSNWWQYGCKLLKGAIILGLGYAMLRETEDVSKVGEFPAERQMEDPFGATFSGREISQAIDFESSTTIPLHGKRQLLEVAPKEGEFDIHLGWYWTGGDLVATSSLEHVRVIWEVEGDQTYRIFNGQRLDKLGNFLGTPFEYNIETPISWESRNTAITELTDGFALSWTKLMGEVFAVYARSYSASGTVLVNDAIVATSDLITIPNIIPIQTDPNSFVVLWGSSGVSGALCMRQYNSSSMTWLDEIIISKNYLDSCYRNDNLPSVSATALSDGRGVVVWRSLGYSSTAETDTTISAAIFDGSGSFVTIHVASSEYYGLTEVYGVNAYDDVMAGVGPIWYNCVISPKVATLTDDGFVIVWVDIDENSAHSIYAQRYDRAGNVQGEAIHVIDSCTPPRPEVIGTKEGFSILWEMTLHEKTVDSSLGLALKDYSEQKRYNGKRYDFEGREIGGEFSILSGDADGEIANIVAVGLSGNPFVVWTDWSRKSVRGRILSQESDYATEYSTSGICPPILPLWAGMLLGFVGIPVSAVICCCLAVKLKKRCKKNSDAIISSNEEEGIRTVGERMPQSELGEGIDEKPEKVTSAIIGSSAMFGERTAQALQQRSTQGMMEVRCEVSDEELGESELSLM